MVYFIFWRFTVKKTLTLLFFSIVIVLSACSQPTSPSNHKLDEQLDAISPQPTTQLEVESLGNQQDIEHTPSAESTATTTPTIDNQTSQTESVVTEPEDYDYVLIFPSDKYPETALHIYGAIEQGYSDVCTIDRDGADDNRKESLKGIPTMEGFDRDEWPMAMCKEGGKGASVAYISASDNRGAGSWVGNELSQYENGERILFIVEKPTQLFPSNIDTTNKAENNIEPVQSTTEVDEVVYNSCKEAREAGAAPIKLGEPGYSKKLDRDGDGIACET